MLHQAIHNGHSKCIQACLSSRNSEELNSALHLAAALGRNDVIRDLLDVGADAGTRDHKGRAVLLHAVCSQDVGTVETLLQAGVNPNEVSSCTGINVGGCGLTADYVFRSYTCTPVMVAVYSKNFAMVNVLIRHGAVFNMTWDFYDLQAYMPKYLHNYTSEDLEELLVLVWQTQDSVGYNLMDHAILKSDSDTLCRILDRQILAAQNDSLQTNWALMLESAVGIGDVDKLSVILACRERYDLDVNLPSRDGYSPLLETCLECNDPDIAEVLLSHGANPDIQTTGYRHATPLFISIQTMKREKNSMHILVCLLRNNCRVDIKCPTRLSTTNEVFVTALDLALITYNLYGAQALVSAGAQVYEPSYIRGDFTTKQDPGFVHCTEEQRNEFIREHLQTPSSLKMSCRHRIRTMMLKDTEEKIKLLPLPKCIKRFLNYSDLQTMADEFMSEMVEFCDDSIPDLSNLTF